jgi:eukaryotic-like serine/threonine-protein kinase
MTLTVGGSLGPYLIEAPLGAGGMGEVYRGRDTRLGRPVAIKVLPGDFAASDDLRERFEREARLLSSLNHPHICVVYDIGRQDGRSYLVMELLEGETLGARLARGPLPVQQATTIALQIGSALDRAHRLGIVHRDVKPENVMLTKAGAKLLDFGLAKPLTLPTELGGPTQTQPLTGQGTILGTLQYMAPEQLEGRPADARSDIFALGAVVFEMVSGKRAFQGDSPVSVISSILRDTPRPLTDLQPFVPPALDEIVRTCLEKDPEERWQSAHDLASQLRWIQQSGSQLNLPAQRGVRRKTREYAAWALVLLLTLAVAGLSVPYIRSQPLDESIQFSIGEPPGARFNPGNLVAPTPAVSPDGRHIVFSTFTSGHGLLYLRSLDTAEARPIPGTEGGSLPFWSADSRSIGFYADRAIKKTTVELSGVETICTAEFFEGATWNRNNVVLFSPGDGGLLRVDANGGEPIAVTALDTSKKETSHRWPIFLPDGEHFLYLSFPGNVVYRGGLDKKPAQRLLTADAKAIYAPPGYLLFAREGKLFAQRFDADRGKLAEEPVRVADSVRASVSGGRGAYSVSDTGVLVYRSGDARLSAQVRWADRNGTRGDLVLQAADYRGLALSPDASRVAFHRHEQSSGGGIWVKDLNRGNVVRLTSPASHDADPSWTSDGRQIAFTSNRSGVQNIYLRNASGAGDEELLLKSPEPKKWPKLWGDPPLLFYQVNTPATQSDIWVLPARGGTPAVYLNSAVNEIQPELSPDGKWLAYVSDESGPPEVFVQPYPADGRKYPVSSGGGVQPSWRKDGAELFYLTLAGTLSAIRVNTHPTNGLELGRPQELFGFDISGSGPDAATLYSAMPDGKRFLIAERPTKDDQGAVEPITVVVNWLSALSQSK